MVIDSLRRRLFKRLLHLSLKAKYQCRPNPAVAAILVKNGRVIGAGETQPPGEAHAEIKALNSVKDKSLLPGSEIYVTLMPCLFHGRTPSCMQALQRCGVKKIHVALRDPNPLMKRYERQLDKKKVTLLFDFPEAVRRELFFINLDYFKKQLTSLPLFLAKYVITLDGKMATYKGESQWISSDASREEVHHQRACYDGILVGGRTFALDNPSLNARIDRPCRQPLPIVILSNPFSMQQDYHLLKKERPALFVLREDMQGREELEIFLKERNKTVVTYGQKDHYATPAFWKKLSALFELNSIYLEGGAVTQHVFMKHSLIDKVEAYIAPALLLDGLGGLSPFSGPQSVASIRSLKRLGYPKRELLPEDVKISGYLKAGQVEEMFQQLS